jgi:hypothetical protein
LEGLVHRVGLAGFRELEIDHHVVRVFISSEDRVAKYARGLASDRIGLEGLLPPVVVAYLVLDAQNMQ